MQPTNTTHVVIVPKVTNASWWHFTKYFEVVHTYRTDSHDFSISKSDPRFTSALEPVPGSSRFIADSLPCEFMVLHRDIHTPVQIDDYLRAHLRFGHMSAQYISQLVVQGVSTGLQLDTRILDKCKPPCNCEVCKLSKMRRPGPFSKNDPSRIYDLLCLEYVVSDITGPIFPTSKDGNRYIIHFTCIRSGYTFMYFMATRDQAAFYFLQFLLEARSYRLNVDVLVVKTDNGGEYISPAFKKVMDDNKVRHIYMSAWLHEENARAEIIFRNRSNMARAFLLTSGLENEYWPLMYRHANWIANRMPNQNREWEIPYFVLRKHLPDLSSVRIIGATAYAHVDKTLRKKLGNKAVKLTYVGHCQDSSAYLLLHVETGRLIKSGRPQFVEHVDCRLLCL